MVVRVSALLAAAIVRAGRFVGVRVEPGVVELAAYELDPGYWDLIAEDPDD